MDFPSLMRFVSWFVPIPFMLLYHIKTDKLNRLSKLILPISLVSIFILTLTYTNGLEILGFRPELIVFYILMLCFSFILFRNKYDFPQAISITICLTFFGSLFWELPYHGFTIYHRGYIDQAFPLHLLYAFPLVFVWQKIKLRVDELDASLIGISLGFSTLSMILLLDLGADIFWTYNNPPNLWLIIESLWFFVRIICFTSLYIIFYRGSLRHNPNCPVEVHKNGVPR